jgi:hypothetical protein
VVSEQDQKKADETLMKLVAEMNNKAENRKKQDRQQ